MLFFTLADVLMMMRTSHVWFFGVGIVFIVILLITKFLIKGIKWLTLTIVFGLILLFIYGAVFSSTTYSPQSPEGEIHDQATGFYKFLQNNIRGGVR